MNQGLSMLDRFLNAFYCASRRPSVIKLTVGQATQIQDEMTPSGRSRLVLTRDMDVRVLGRPVEWVNHESESILG